MDHLVLFGSQARGDTGTWSDADILVVSPAFEDVIHVDRAYWVRRQWDLDLPVDILCYTPAEFDRLKEQVSIVRVALQEGIEVEAAA